MSERARQWMSNPPGLSLDPVFQVSIFLRLLGNPFPVFFQAGRQVIVLWLGSHICLCWKHAWPYIWSTILMFVSTSVVMLVQLSHTPVVS
jgi:hypothetical protein